MIRRINPGTACTQAVLVILLAHSGLAFGYSAANKTPSKQEAHDTNHPLILASDADFLAGLLALHKEALSVSRIAATKAKQAKIKEYAKQAINRHREQITRLSTLLSRHGSDVDSDFHIVPAASTLRETSGNAAGTQYLRVMIRLTSEKIELAEFASGTVKAKQVQRLAATTIEKNSGELLMLTRWLDRTLPN